MILVRPFLHSAANVASKLKSRAAPSTTTPFLRRPKYYYPGVVRLFATTNTNSFENFLKKRQDVVVTYLTDVEGDKAYLDRYVETSKVLKFVESSSSSEDDTSLLPYDKCIEFTQDNAMLVYGGDVWDKGGFDLYVIRQLLDLKRRHPDRVVLILGNRDINKLRILQEIGVSNTKLPKHPGLLWFKGTGRLGDPDSNPPPDDAIERLQWMLGQTMGSPNAFDHRKNELIWENKDSGKEITDEDVVESYQRSCHPKGELGQYLSQSQLATKLGPLLFVHGSLPLTKEVLAEANKNSQESLWDDLTFCMPWLEPGESAKDHGVTTIDEWLDALNQFCSDRVQDWKEEIARIESSGRSSTIWAFRGGYHYRPSYSALIQYGLGMTPERKQNPTVVYNSFTPNGMPHSFYPDAEDGPDYFKYTREFFDRADIQVILTGHKPQGDMPSPIRIDSSSWILCCDTSYSSETIWYHKNNTSAATTSEPRTNLGRGNAVSFRGDVAVSEVLLELTNGGGSSKTTLESVRYHGVLSDGTEYETLNLLDNVNNSTIGQAAPEHLVPSELDSPHQGRWWTKSIFSDGSHLFHAGEGFHVWNFVSKPKS
jgi:hypothetical protein